MKSTLTTKPRVGQCQKPSGWLGRLVLHNMNSRHSKMTDWGLSHVAVDAHFTILEVGCGGGRTLGKLAALAVEGRVCGLDHSGASVAVATKANREWIKTGRVEIREGSVSQMPFTADTFDLVLAIETHIWWPDLATDMLEVCRVLKPGGTLAVISEVYRGAQTTTARLAEKYLPATGMNLLTPDEHRDLLASAGFADVQVAVEPTKGWICAIGKKVS